MSAETGIGSYLLVAVRGPDSSARAGIRAWRGRDLHRWRSAVDLEEVQAGGDLAAGARVGRGPAVLQHLHIGVEGARLLRAGLRIGDQPCVRSCERGEAVG